uniref:recombinase family protein n=1 Tax=Sulfuriferula sp. GW6 TaxID=3345112 RepID=UPI0039F7106C
MAKGSTPKYFAYLRVSRDTQDTANQKLGLLEYANRLGFAPLKIVEDTQSRGVSWRQRALGALLVEASAGDVILSPEVSRLGGSALQVLEFLHEALAKGVYVHVTKSRFIFDDSLQATIQATVLGLAAQIEREFIRVRTREALARRRAEGKPLGRPKGSQGSLKLDGREDEIAGYLALELPRRKIAKRLKVSYNTLALFIERRKLNDRLP